MTFKVCNWILPLRPESRILISVPHAGTFIPPEVQKQLNPMFKNHCPDTDWYVDELYGFCKELYPQVAMVKSDYSRYVVDLNRSKDLKKLYSDGRPENSFIPLTSFKGEPLYPKDIEPNESEINRRALEYYDPYHFCLRSSLNSIQENHGQALLVDGHSITRIVPQLVKDKLPDFMLGNFDHQSCSEDLLELIRHKITSFPQNYSCVANQFFKGGFITRSLGKKTSPIQSIQIEMSQDLYLTSESSLAKSSSFSEIQDLFKEIIQTLLTYLQNKQIYK